jgi:endonuclease YncB( thermonuclease family)
MLWRAVRWWLPWAFLAAAGAPAATLAATRVVDGLAIVQDDGSLRVAGETVYLYGVYIPQYQRTCTNVVNPTRCAASPVLVLDSLVDGFVRCEIVRQGRDALQGVCTQAGRKLFGPREDIAATMISRGWALAAEYAPPQYRALESLAKSREIGLWGPNIVRVR